MRDWCPAPRAPIDRKLHDAYNDEYVEYTKEGLIMAPIAFTLEAGNAALEAAYEGARADNWDGVGSKRVELSTYKYAQQFLQFVPNYIALPDIVADTDGEILFEWDYGPQQVFAVSIDKYGTLSYAGLFSRRKVHGREPFSAPLPSAILSGFEQLSNHVGS
jgi:hypothetical protein